MEHIKKQLYQHCLLFVEEQIQAAQRGIENADEAAKSETKSSAGDKHETGRAMIHLEKEQQVRRLKEATEQQKALQEIDMISTHKEVQKGSLVKTSNGNYFIALSAGKFDIDNEEYLTISLSSPLGKALEGYEKGDIVSFRDKEIEILLMT